MNRITIKCPKCEGAMALIDSIQADYLLACRCRQVSVAIEVLPGFVYILTNSAMPGIVKIGFTERSVDERVSELSAASGIPARFEIAFTHPSKDPLGDERHIHALLCAFRINQGREFFRLERDEAIRRVCLALKIPLPEVLVKVDTATRPAAQGYYLKGDPVLYSDDDLRHRLRNNEINAYAYCRPADGSRDWVRLSELSHFRK